MIHNKLILTGLDHSQYEHPLDRAALEKLESIPFLTTACKWVTSNFIERVYNIQYAGSNLNCISLGAMTSMPVPLERRISSLFSTLA